MQPRLYQVGWKILDVLFPPICAGCGSGGERFCPSCCRRIQLITDPVCQLCGHPLNDPGLLSCERCRNQHVAFSAIRSWAVFADPLQSAIHRLKYHQDRGLGEILAEPLSTLLLNYNWKIDLIIPVPIDDIRRKARGYNQAALLAKPISWKTGIPYTDQALLKKKVTRQQAGLSLLEREENMADAFEGDKNKVFGRNILVVDDVITTGSTVNSCAQALITAGAVCVFGITLARALLTQID